MTDGVIVWLRDQARIAKKEGWEQPSWYLGIAERLEAADALAEALMHDLATGEFQSSGSPLDAYNRLRASHMEGTKA